MLKLIFKNLAHEKLNEINAIMKISNEDNPNEDIKEIFESLLSGYPLGSERSVKESDFIFDSMPKDKF